MVIDSNIALEDKLIWSYFFINHKVVFADFDILIFMFGDLTDSILAEL